MVGSLHSRVVRADTNYRAVDHEVVKAPDRCSVSEGGGCWRDQQTWQSCWRGKLPEKPRFHVDVARDDPQTRTSLSSPTKRFQQLLVALCPLLRVVDVNTEHREPPLHDGHPRNGEPPLMRLQVLALPTARRPYPFQPPVLGRRNEGACRCGHRGL